MIISTTLLGPGTEHLLAEALQSCSFADLHVVVDTRPTPRPDIPGEWGDKVRWTYFTWTGSFADARNYALGYAFSLGAKWALTVDTDERILHASTGLPDADVILCFDETRSYAKERLIRLPAKGVWKGAVHECFVGGSRAVDSFLTVRELPKTPEQLRAKFERDRVALEKMVQDGPADPRWHFYLAETRDNLGDKFEAIREYNRAAGLSHWDEECAWCYYKIGLFYSYEGHFDSGLTYAFDALKARADHKESAWLAGFCCYYLGRYRDALCWARMAKTIDTSARIGFRHHPDIDDLERWALSRLQG